MIEEQVRNHSSGRDARARVLMVAPYYPYPVAGGIEKQAHELARTLTAMGTPVLALGVHHADGQRDVETVDGIPVLRLPWSEARVWRYLRTPFDLFAALVRTRARYDLVHVHVPSWFGLMTIACAKLLGKPVLTKLPNIGAKGIPGMRAGRCGWVAVAILRRSDAIVAMSGESLEELRAIDFPLSRTLTTTNGIAMPAASVERGWRGEGNRLRAVFVGRLVEQKGVRILLQAWKLVHEGGDVDALLELWGEGPQQAELEQLSRGLGIDGRVVFRGHVDGAATKLAEVAVFVLPSFLEGNSNSLLEAMVAGLPVVATRVGGTPMLVGQAGAPWLIEPGDAKALAGKLRALLVDAALRRELGAAMRARVEQCFDIRRVAQTYQRAYGLLANGEARRIQECKDSWPYEAA